VVGIVAFSVRGPRTDPAPAVLLNLVLPGLGYAYLGRWIRFLLVAGPLVLLLASNLVGEVRALVEPARLMIARSLSFGASTINPVLVVLVWLVQIVDAGRVAKRGRSLELSRSREGGKPDDGPREEPDQAHG
jgi:hypothetical protein